MIESAARLYEQRDMVPMLNATECCLCSQIAGQPSNDLIARLLPDRPYARRVMLDTPFFAVIPSLGPLTAGHSLMCPKSHIRSFVQLDAHSYDEFRRVKRTLKSALERLYEAGVHLFEHGMAAAGSRILCSVDHAHMHFVPLPDGSPLPVKEQDGWVGFDGSIEAWKQLSGNREYIFYESPDDESSLLRSDAGEMESQYMRKLFAKVLSRGDRWNWREHPNALTADAIWRSFVAMRHSTSGRGDG